MLVKLKKLSPDDEIDIYNMLQEIPKDENGFINDCNGLSYDDYRKWLIRSHNIANGINLEDWMVPQNTYWLYVDGNPIGMGKLRFRLTERTKEDGGHCGYGIIPTQRKNGYGKILLRLLVGEAKKVNIDRILLTIENDNLASIKVALNSGGIIEKVSDELHYIWIDCNTYL